VDVVSGTKYPEVNKRVNKLVNRGKFPDFLDIVNLLKKAKEAGEVLFDNDEQMDVFGKRFCEP
jgi:hypothetical protein